MYSFPFERAQHRQLHPDSRRQENIRYTSAIAKFYCRDSDGESDHRNLIFVIWEAEMKQGLYIKFCNAKSAEANWTPLGKRENSLF